MKQDRQTDFHAVVEHMNQVIQVNTNFDLVYRTLEIGGRMAAMYFVDGMIKDDIMEKLLEVFQEVSSEEMPDKAHDFSKKIISYVEANLETEEDTLVVNLLTGMVLLYIEGYDDWLVIDCRIYPVRGVTEPEKDKVLRGSRDGFVETLNFNSALIRRRIRSKELRMHLMRAGKSSKTDIVLCYMDNRVDKTFLNQLISKIENISADALTMNQQSLAECLYTKLWINRFPKIKYSERPDTAAASVLEGKIVILVDNSPAAMILPTSVFDVLEEANDYYFPPITGTYLRFSRFIVTFVTLFLTPVFVLLMQNQEWIPEALEFIIVKDTIHIPLLFQLLILEL